MRNAFIREVCTRISVWPYGRSRIFPDLRPLRQPPLVPWNYPPIRPLNPSERLLMKGELTTGFGSGSISLRNGAGALFRRKALVLLTFLTVVLGTAIVTFLLPNKYESRMKILVKNQRVDVAITPEATAGAPSAESEVSESQINSEIELLTSRDLLTQVVKECGLAKFETGWFGKSAPEAVRVEAAATRLSKDLLIAPVKKAN